MPRTGQGPRLWKRPAAYNEDGTIRKHSVWIIKDGRTEKSTGCVATAGEVVAPVAAQTALSDYIASKYSVVRKARDIEDIGIDDVLLVYLQDHVDLSKPKEERTSKERHLIQTIDRLNDYWAPDDDVMVLTDINTQKCKGYVKHRAVKNLEAEIADERERAEKEKRKPNLKKAEATAQSMGTGGARRDLEILRAAINHHSSENLHYGKVSVWLPEKGEARDRWLERSEAAAMLWHAYRYREVQTIHVGPDKGRKVVTNRRPLRHVARFLLIGFYTGTRAGAIASASKRRAIGKSYVDLERGLYYRKPVGKKATKKRQPPAPLPPRLLTHMRRWDRLGIANEHFVEYNGKPVLSVKKAFRKVVQLAKIDVSIENVTPHTLRHTAATWLMQRGTDLWTAAGYLGMTVEVLERIYGHHHPDHLGEAVANITQKAKRK